jgi:hypothetical protein
MKPIFRMLVLTLGLVLAQPGSGQALELNTQVQDGLIAAQAVRGPGVDRQLFNGKPVLVVFFASW